MVDDITALAGSVSAVAGSGPIIIIASPRQAISLSLRTVDFPFQVLPSAGLADKTVLAIAGNALASALDPMPRLDVGSEGPIVMADDAGPISTSGAIATPTRSLWAD